MGKMLKKNSGVFYWIVLPCLILMASVFAVNLIPRPAISLYGSSGCNTSGPDPDADCTGNPTNICVAEFCDQITCDISGYDIGVDTICQCGTCGNGRCEQALGEDFDSCFADCSTDNFASSNGQFPPPTGGVDGQRDDFVCLNPDFGQVPCGVDLKKQGGSGDIGPALDGCCPTGCQGTDSASAATFDADCAPNFDGTQCLDLCGNGVIDTGEECDPEASQTNCLSDETCNAVTCQCQSALPTPVISPFPPPGTDLEGSGILSCSLQREPRMNNVQGSFFLMGLGAAVGILAVLRRRST
jgi:hypothetical protein